MKNRGKSVQQGKRLPEADFQVQMLLLILHVLDNVGSAFASFDDLFHSFSTVNFNEKHISWILPITAEVRVALPMIPTRVETTPASPPVSQRRESVTQVKPFKEIKDEGAEGAEGTKTLDMQVIQ